MNLSIMVKNYKGKVCNMYQDEYKRWLAADLEDADLKPELARIEGNDDEIKDRFAVGASAQHAAQAGGAKLQRNGEAVLDLVVISLDLGQFRLQICVFQICCQPALILILIHIAHLTFVIFDHNGQIHPSLLIL